MRFEYLIASFVLTVLLLGVGTAIAETDTVVLSSDSVADQTVSDALAVKEDGEVVTTEWGDETDAAVEEAVEEVDDKKPVKIYIVGGTVAVSKRIQDRLLGLGYAVIRLGGADRYETSAVVAGQWGDSEEVAVADGLDDEGMEEARNETRKRTRANVIPVLLVKPDSVPNVVKNRIRTLNAKKVRQHVAANTNETEVDDDLEDAGINETNKTSVPKEERASNAIDAAKEALTRAEGIVSEANTTKKAAERLLQNARNHLGRAEMAFSEGKYGMAFGLAVASKHGSANAAKIAKRIQVTELARVHKVESLVREELNRRIAALKLEREEINARLQALRRNSATVLQRINDRIRVNVTRTSELVEDVDVSEIEDALESDDLDDALELEVNITGTLDDAETNTTSAEQEA